jgi:NAD(P)-dependent dehydrogenase (short-subunit alcohol dehydrogenase family)
LILATRESLPMLREAGAEHGKALIVNLASIAGTVPAPRLAVYGATKAAVVHLTRSLNAELEGHGIRAAALSPGFVDTPMASWTGMASEEMIQPEDCAEVVRMLLRLSPAARIPHVVIERLGSGGA